MLDPIFSRRRDIIACAACYALVFVVLPALFFLAAALRGWRP